MLRSKTQIFLAVIAVFLCFLTLHALGQSGNNIAITINITNTSVSKEEPIICKISLTNISSHAIGISEDNSRPGEMDYGVQVRDQRGAEVRKTHYYRILSGEQDPQDAPVVVMRSSHLRSLQPQESLVNAVDLRKLYDFSSPGNYSVVVGRIDPITNALVMSNTIAFSITE